MSIDQAMANLSRAKMEHAKTLGKKTKTKKRKKPTSFFRIKSDLTKGVILETKKEVVQAIGMSDPVRDSVRWQADKKYGLDIAFAVTGEGFLIFWGKGKQLSASVAKDLAAMSTDHLITKFGLSLDSIRKANKKSSLATMYGSTTPSYAASYGGPATTSSKW